MKAISMNKRERGQGLVEYALILVLVAVVVIVILALVGPSIGNAFSTIKTGLTGAGGAGGGGGPLPTAVPTVVPTVAPTAVPTLGTYTVNFNCSASGWVDVKNMTTGGTNLASFNCTPNAPTSYNVTGQTSGTWIQFRNMYNPYTTLLNYTVP